MVLRVDGAVDTSIPCLKAGANKIQRVFTAGYLGKDMLPLIVNDMKWKLLLEVRVFTERLRAY